jgi:tetratricopeptide (TPR) repeat protein
MSDIFISHVEEDTEMALQIACGLEAAGYTAWSYERDSYPGLDYLDQVEKAIEGSQAVIVLISPEALGSQQVEDEVKWAREQGKPLVPILKGISWSEFQNRRPRWRMALGIAAAVSVPPEGVGPIIARLVRGLEELRVKPRTTKKNEARSQGGLTSGEEPIKQTSGTPKPEPEPEPRVLEAPPPGTRLTPVGPLIKTGGTAPRKQTSTVAVSKWSKPFVALATVLGAALLVVTASVWQLRGRKHSILSLVKPAQTDATLPNSSSRQHVDRGNTLMRERDPDGAIAEYREAIRLRPDAAVAHLELGHALAGKGDLDGAIAECHEAIRLKPDYEQAHYVLGNVLGEKGDWDGEISEEREAIRLKPNEARAHLSLGRALEHKGMRQQALGEYRKARQIDPSNLVFWGDYERLAKQLGQQ